MTAPNPAAFGMEKGDLPKIQGFLNEARPKFMKESSVLDGQIQGLLASGYKGNGANALRQLQAAWTEKHSMIVKTINEFEQALGLSHKWTMDTDETAASAASARMQKLDI